MRAICVAAVLFGIGAGVVPATVTERAPFESYQFIAERKPFGDIAPKAAAVAVALPTPEVAAVPTPQGPPLWIASLKLCAIVLKDGQAPRVGLYDSKTKNSLFLYEGEADEYFIVKVDYEGEKALIEKDGRRFWFRTEGDPYEDGTEPTAVTAAAHAAPGAGVAAPTAAAGGSVAALSPGMTIGTPRTRVRGRPAARPALTAEEYEKIKHTLPPPVSPTLMAARAEGTAPPPMSPAQLERYLQEQQMELIRAQAPIAMPLPLTPEMDRQLVREGVLPPQ